MNFDTALTDFNSRQFKTWMKKMAAQVNLFCFLMFFSCLACSMVPENWHICVNKGITYLLTDLETSIKGLVEMLTRQWDGLNKSCNVWKQGTRARQIHFQLTSNFDVNKAKHNRYGSGWTLKRSSIKQLCSLNAWMTVETSLRPLTAWHAILMLASNCYYYCSYKTVLNSDHIIAVATCNR